MKLEEIVNKTIKSVYYGYGSRVAIRFTDDSAIAFYVKSCYDSIDIDVDEIEDWEKVKLGLITEKEYDRLRLEQELKWKQEQENRQHREYEELKKKFGETK
jgi:hypothetical protein